VKGSVSALRKKEKALSASFENSVFLKGGDNWRLSGKKDFPATVHQRGGEPASMGLERIEATSVHPSKNGWLDCKITGSAEEGHVRGTKIGG